MPEAKHVLLLTSSYKPNLIIRHAFTILAASFYKYVKLKMDKSEEKNGVIKQKLSAEKRAAIGLANFLV